MPGKKSKFIIPFLVLILCSILSGCSDNSVENTETLIFQLDGVIESLDGDCSGVQVRTRDLGDFDFRASRKIKLNFSGMSDADLSSISIFYNQNDEPVYLMNLTNREQINNTASVEINSPNVRCELFSRVTLKSSVCTGQIFYIKFSDLKVYSVN